MRTSPGLFMFTAALIAACPLSAQESPSATTATPPAVAAPAVAAPAPATTPTPAVANGATATETRFTPYAATKDGAARRLTGNETVNAPAAPVSAMRAATSHNMALMIVGGAGLLVGAVVGGQAGDIIMIGSGVVGLYGLYKYLQ